MIAAMIVTLWNAVVNAGLAAPDNAVPAALGRSAAFAAARLMLSLAEFPALAGTPEGTLSRLR